MESTSTSAGPLGERPPIGRMVLRGALRRCPWCGDRRAYFTGWFAKQDECRGCGMAWRRGDVGFELGAMTVNVIITFGVIVVGVTAGMIATAPDFAVAEIVVALVVGAAVVPVLLYPVTYTLWQALDLAMRPPEVASPPASSARRVPAEKQLGDP